MGHTPWFYPILDYFFNLQQATEISGYIRSTLVIRSQGRFYSDEALILSPTASSDPTDGRASTRDTAGHDGWCTRGGVVRVAWPGSVDWSMYTRPAWSLLLVLAHPGPWSWLILVSGSRISDSDLRILDLGHRNLRNLRTWLQSTFSY